MGNITFEFKTANVLLKVLDKVLKSKIHVDGEDHISNHPTMFVVNHFTRMETFILPYIIYNLTGQMMHSLADSSLFNGKLGDYLRRLGAISTKEPFRNRKIIEELMKGSHSWVIFPEGVMVKNKIIYENGKYMLNNPDRIGPPHTGAAVLALKAELYKRSYMNAVHKQDFKTMELFQKRYNFTSPQDICQQEIVICPVNISYYPIRAENNFLSSIIHYFVKEMPQRIEEEIQMESSLLTSDTDISIYFGKPISLDKYLSPWFEIGHKYFPFIKEKKRSDIILYAQKNRLTHNFMDAIYKKTAINLDHIFCTCLYYCKKDSIQEENLFRMIFLIAEKIRYLEDRRLHPSLNKGLLSLLADQHYAPYDSIFNLAQNEGAFRFEEGRLLINKNHFSLTHSFHNVRLKNMVSVLVNETKPFIQITKIIKKICNLDSRTLKKNVVETMSISDQRQYKYDYNKYYQSEYSKNIEIGKPIFLKHQNSKLGILLSHGYLSGPKEMESMANYLHNLGYTVYVIRLKGHGTAPKNLKFIDVEDWVHSMDRGYVTLKNYCQQVILGGFSAGGLLALYYSTLLKSEVSGVFTINAALKLNDIKSHLVPTVNFWNELLDKFNINKGQLEYVENESENPEVNYSRNYLHGVYILEKLINKCNESLSKVCLPTLILQAKNDPVVSPKSSEIIYQKIQSEQKRIFEINSDKHIIVKGDNKEDVFRHIQSFVSELLNNNKAL